jgi:hypothetical protein
MLLSTFCSTLVTSQSDNANTKAISFLPRFLKKVFFSTFDKEIVDLSEPNTLSVTPQLLYVTLLKLSLKP